MSTRNVYLVGSVPMADAATVFETVSAALGSALLTLPDGETGKRLDWITWLEPVFRDNPAFELSRESFQLHGLAAKHRRYRLKPGVSIEDVGSTISFMPTSPRNRTPPSRRSSARARFPPTSNSRSTSCRRIR